MFGRSPLFFCHNGHALQLKKFVAAHWSPVIAYLEEDDLVLVMDVNSSYGRKGYLVPR